MATSNKLMMHQMLLACRKKVPKGRRIFLCRHNWEAVDGDGSEGEESGTEGEVGIKGGLETRVARLAHTQHAPSEP